MDDKLDQVAADKLDGLEASLPVLALAPDAPSADDARAAEERRLVRKLDLAISPSSQCLGRTLTALEVPFIVLAYFIAVIDRVNLGNTRLMGVTADALDGDPYLFNVASMLMCASRRLGSSIVSLTPSARLPATRGSCPRRSRSTRSRAGCAGSISTSAWPPSPSARSPACRRPSRARPRSCSSASPSAWPRAHSTPAARSTSRAGSPATSSACASPSGPRARSWPRPSAAPSRTRSRAGPTPALPTGRCCSSPSACGGIDRSSGGCL